MNIFKKIFAPTEAKQEFTVLRSWTVSWESRYGQFSGDTQKEFEVFISEEEANQFANQLKDAYKLLKHTHGTKVSITENKQMPL